MELDIFDRFPEDQLAYLKNYGWNFSKKACKYAVSLMNHKGKTFVMENKDTVMDILKRNNVQLKYDNGYNGVYVYYMSLADYLGESIDDEQHLCKHVKCIIDDEDNKGGNVFRKWYTDCVHKGIAINWEDLI